MSLASKRQSQRHLERQSQDFQQTVARHERLQEEESSIRQSANAPERADARRSSIQAQQQQKSAFESSQIQQSLQNRQQLEWDRQQQEQEQKRLDEEERKKLSQERYLMAIRQNSSELRELESKLKSGYIGKDRQLQMKEFEVQKQRLVLEKEIFDRQWLKQIEAQNEQAVMEEEAKFHQSEKYRHELQEQIVAVEKKRDEKYLQFLEEKAAIDEVIRKIMEDDEKQMRLKLERQNEAKTYIDQFIKERILWKEEEQKRVERENQLIAEYAQELILREESKKASLKQEAQQRDEIYEMMAKTLEAKERERAEMDQLQVELNDFEQEERLKLKEMEAAKKRIRQRLELIEGYQTQMEYKRGVLEKEEMNEVMFRNEMMAKFAEEERLHQLNDQKRRMKQAEHKREVDKLIAFRREKREAARAEELKLELKQDEMSQLRRQVVEQERQRMLREHAVNLLGYLPKGIFRDENDLKLFDEDFQVKFQESVRKAEKNFGGVDEDSGDEQ